MLLFWRARRSKHARSELSRLTYVGARDDRLRPHEHQAAKPYHIAIANVSAMAMTKNRLSHFRSRKNTHNDSLDEQATQSASCDKG
jgi:hypothetical protein